MVVVLSGPNSFALRQELNRITTQFTREQGDFGLEKIEAGSIEVGRLLESVSSLPFLASRRMIILTDVSVNKAIPENIEQLLDAIADTTDLVIVEPKFDKRSSLYKTLKKRTDFKEFSELDDQQLAKWLVKEAGDKKAKLSIADATYLIQRSGNDQMSLGHEIEKLSLYDPEITRQTVDLLVDPLSQGSVFELLDAAFAGKHKRALELYQAQRKQQVEPQVIMGMIAWQLHILAVVKVNQKLNSSEIATKAKLNPYVVGKTLNIARSLSYEEVKDLISRALDLDIKLKTQPIDADDALQHLLLTLV